MILQVLPFLLYVLLLFWLGFRAYKKDANEEEYLLSNRSLSIPAFVATLVTTWYGGILGVGEFIHQVGISAWIVFGLPYYFFEALFAIYLAPKIRNAASFSIPDTFYQTYDKRSGRSASFFLLIMTSPAPYILMLAVLMQQIFGLSFITCVLLGTLFSVLYVYWGGFRSVVQTDKLQFVLMFSGFAILLFYLTTDTIPLTELHIHLDAKHKSLSGGMNWQQLTVWFLIASWTFIDPGFHQRCSAAGSPTVAKKGILLSIGFWFVFDMLTLITGLYAFALYPEIEPLTIYPHLAQEFLPPFLQGLFFTGLLAIIMSTIDSFTFLSAITFGRDIIWRYKNSGDVNRFVRLGLLLTAVISILLIFLFPSVIDMWYNLGSLFIPPLLLPVVSVYFKRFRLSANKTFYAMLSSFLITFVWFIWGQLHFAFDYAQYPLGLEPFFPGLIWSVVFYGLNLWKKK